MKKIIFIFLLPTFVLAWDFVQERNTIPVEFDSVQCQVPWTTGWNYIHPTFCDLDDDGDFDLVFGSDWGRATYIRNIGDENIAIFEFETDTLVNLPHPPPASQLSSQPAFCDIDNDNDYDLIFGAYNRLFFYRNTGTIQNAIFILEEEFYQGIEFYNDQYPSFVDIDNDEDYDLFIGLGYQYTLTAGRIAFYLNEGTPDSALMDSITSYFMNIDLGYYAIPAFCDIDNDGDYDMFLGEEDGLIHYYRNDGTPEVYDFIGYPVYSGRT